MAVVSVPALAIQAEVIYKLAESTYDFIAVLAVIILALAPATLACTLAMATFAFNMLPAN